MKHNEAIKAISKAINEKQDEVSYIDDGKNDQYDQISVEQIRSRLVKEERSLTGSMFALRELEKGVNDSTQIDNFMYEMDVNERGEIPCFVELNGVEHSFVITERDVKGFMVILQGMNKF